MHFVSQSRFLLFRDRRFAKTSISTAISAFWELIPGIPGIPGNGARTTVGLSLAPFGMPCVPGTYCPWAALGWPGGMLVWPGCPNGMWTCLGRSKCQKACFYTILEVFGTQGRIPIIQRIQRIPRIRCHRPLLATCLPRACGQDDGSYTKLP